MQGKSLNLRGINLWQPFFNLQSPSSIQFADEYREQPKALWVILSRTIKTEEQSTMTKKPLNLDEMEVSLALHALRFYKNAKGNEVSSNTERLETKLDDYLSGTTFVVEQVENVASILGARGGSKGGTSTSAAKKAAAALNGAKGGRPPRPNLYIKFSKSVWVEPDPKLLNELYTLIGNNTWLPDEHDTTEGPYVRVHVPEISAGLEKLLSNSLNVFEWDEKGLYRFCMEHTNNSSYELPAAEKLQSACTVCGNPAVWIY